MKSFHFLLIATFLLSACSAPKRLTKPDQELIGNFKDLRQLLNETEIENGYLITSSNETFHFIEEPILDSTLVIYKDSLHVESKIDQSKISEFILFESYPYGEAAYIGFKRTTIVTGIIIASLIEVNHPKMKDRLIAYPLGGLFSYMIGTFGGMAMMETGFEGQSRRQVIFTISK